MPRRANTAGKHPPLVDVAVPDAATQVDGYRLKTNAHCKLAHISKERAGHAHKTRAHDADLRKQAPTWHDKSQ